MGRVGTLFVLTAVWLSVAGSIGCIGPNAHATAARLRQSPALLFAGDETGYTGPETTQPGWHALTFRNDGAQAHEVLLLRMPEGTTTRGLDAELAQDAGSLRIEVRLILTPGETSRAAAQLFEGVYIVFTRPLVEPRAPDGGHGMMRELVVGRR